MTSPTSYHFITPIGTTGSEYISQLDVYHGQPGRACCIKTKHPLLDRSLQAHHQGKVIQLNSHERYVYYTQDDMIDYDETSDLTFEEQHLSDQYDVPDCGFFRRMPHKDFKPLKSIIFQIDDDELSMNGLCFSNGKKSFKSAMDQRIFESAAAVDDTEPYRTNLVKWSRVNLGRNYRNCEMPQTWLSENEYFAYADLMFLGLKLDAVKLFKFKICTIE